MSLETFPARRSLLAAALLLPVTAADGQPAAQEAAPRTSPAIPGAVIRPPDGMPPGAPFDVASFLAPPPADRDAAPLYLDALFEFSGELAICFPDDDANRRRAREAAERSRRIAAHLDALSGGRPLDAPAADASIAEYAEGHRKLIAAQRRDRCAFATGFGPEALLPHVAASRQVIRVYSVKTARDLDRGEVDDAIGNLAVCLRLSRDLRPRGLPSVQLMADANDWACARTILPRILSARGLKPEHCDRIIGLLADHEAGAVDPYAEAAKADALSIPASVRDLRVRFDAVRQAMGLAADATPADALVGMGASLDDRQKEAVDARLAAWTPGDDAELAAAVYALCEARLAQASPVYAARIAASGRARAAIPGDDAPLRLVVEAFDVPAAGLLGSIARATAGLRAARCLAALRRWQLTGGTPRGDLATMCRAAGLDAVPIDPFDGRPLRMAVTREGVLIYSVGKDLRDDGGTIDSDLDRKPGDLTFRIDPAASH